MLQTVQALKVISAETVKEMKDKADKKNKARSKLNVDMMRVL